MSSDLDKFVLQYTVEMKDAVARLEQLNSKVAKVNKESEKSTSKFKEFTGKATEGLSKVIPGLDGISGALKGITSETKIATAAIAVMTLGLKAAMDTRNDYNEQNKMGMQIGMSGRGVESMTRNLSNNAVGGATPGQLLESMTKLADIQKTAQTDLLGLGVEARKLRMFGALNNKDGSRMSFDQMSEALGKRFASQSDAKTIAEAQTLGIDPNAALTMAKASKDGGVTADKMTPEEKAAREEDEKSIAELNSEMAKLAENFREAAHVIGHNFLPLLTTIMGWAEKASSFLPKIASVITPANVGVAAATVVGGPVGGAAAAALATAKDIHDSANKQKEAAANAAKGADKAAKGQDDTNAKARTLAIEQQRAIAAFSGAVSTFSNAVDEKQAWAAWAGEIGRASGLGSGSDSSSRSAPAAPSDSGATPMAGANKDSISDIGPTKYDDLINAAAARTGVSANLMKRVIRAESNFNPNAVSHAGAVGLGQIMPSNFKALGITNANDPAQNINGMATLLKENLSRSKGDVALALKYYNGGYKLTGKSAAAQKENDEYAGRVLGDGVKTSTLANAGRKYEPSSYSTPDGNFSKRGQSRESMNLTGVQNSLAANLGVNVNQLKEGGVSKADVSVAANNLIQSLKVAVESGNIKLSQGNLQPRQKAQIENETRQAAMNLASMRKYSDSIVDRSKDSPQSLTVGSMPVQIYVNTDMSNVNDPTTHAEILAQKIGEEFQKHLDNAANSSSAGVKK